MSRRSRYHQFSHLLSRHSTRSTSLVTCLRLHRRWPGTSTESSGVLSGSRRGLSRLSGLSLLIWDCLRFHCHSLHHRMISQRISQRISRYPLYCVFSSIRHFVLFCMLKPTFDVYMQFILYLCLCGLFALVSYVSFVTYSCYSLKIIKSNNIYKKNFKSYTFVINKTIDCACFIRLIRDITVLY